MENLSNDAVNRFLEGFASDPPGYLFQSGHLSQVSPEQFDNLLAHGWRHFGTEFFRYGFGFHLQEWVEVRPLRIRLADFSFSASQRRILRKNSDLHTRIAPLQFDSTRFALFDRHKARFANDVPESLYDFLSDPMPCQTLEVGVYSQDKLLAASYLDIGAQAVSSIYAMFEPAAHARSLGIYTMLLEIEYALAQGKMYYYPGYVYNVPSFYDYKKKFAALEYFNWTRWQPLPDSDSASA